MPLTLAQSLSVNVCKLLLKISQIPCGENEWLSYFQIQALAFMLLHLDGKPHLKPKVYFTCPVYFAVHMM